MTVNLHKKVPTLEDDQDRRRKNGSCRDATRPLLGASEARGREEGEELLPGGGPGPGGSARLGTGLNGAEASLSSHRPSQARGELCGGGDGEPLQPVRAWHRAPALWGWNEWDQTAVHRSNAWLSAPSLGSQNGGRPAGAAGLPLRRLRAQCSQEETGGLFCMQKESSSRMRSQMSTSQNPPAGPR